jgi:hypothetical protein
MVCAFGPYVALRFRVFHVGSGKKISTDQWCVCLGHMGLRVHLNPGSENLDFLRTTTISVIPTGANWNFCHTGPGLSWEVRCVCHSDRTAAFWVAGLGERRRLAGTSSRSPS